MRGAWVLSVCMVLAWIAPSHGSECGLIVSPGFEEDNDVQHRGYYFHPDHCFSVVIPEGVVGRTSSQPSSQHGFGVLLSKAPRASYLYVGGDPGSWLDNDDSPRSLEKASRLRLKWLIEDRVTILQKRLQKTRLGELSAVRLVAIYRCPGSANKIVLDSIFALDSGGTFFEVTLEAAKSAYEPGRLILEKVAKSWKLERQKCEENFRRRLRKSP